MNIWTRLGISVALTAAFYIVVAETLQDTLVYEEHKWRFCIGFLVAGAALFFGGSWLNRKLKARYQVAQANLPENERDSELADAEPFMLFNLAYWGVMFGIFSSILVVIVPKPRVPEPPKVQIAARTSAPPVIRTSAPALVRTSAPAAAAPPKPPKLKFQGVVIRDSTRSALINGRTYFVGDWIGDAKLISLDSDKAVLIWNGAELVLPAPR